VRLSLGTQVPGYVLKLDRKAWTAAAESGHLGHQQVNECYEPLSASRAVSLRLFRAGSAWPRASRAILA